MALLRSEIPAIDLPEQRVVQLRLGRGACIRLLAGRAWITAEGDAQDFFLDPGACLRIERGGRVVVEALLPSRIEVQRAVSAVATLRRSLGLEAPTH